MVEMKKEHDDDKHKYSFLTSGREGGGTKVAPTHLPTGRNAHIIKEEALTTPTDTSSRNRMDSHTGYVAKRLQKKPPR